MIVGYRRCSRSFRLFHPDASWCVDFGDPGHLQWIIAGVVVQHNHQAMSAVIVIGVDVTAIAMLEQLIQIADAQAADEGELLPSVSRRLRLSKSSSL
jgi:hypothetical protein